ncbi:MAG: transporter [Verrucomicrobiota bacterium]
MLSIIALPAAAFAADADKSKYSLINPTPRELMREMSTDRPDLTESAYTVDAGHFQIEMDLVNFAYDRRNPAFADVRVEAWSVATANVKVGLLNNLDFQMVLPTFNYVRTDDRTTGTVTRNKGFGDIVLRTKLNLWGNDGGRTAFAIMPFVKLPTNQDQLGNKAYEGGVILPLAVELPRGWSMGLMTEFDFLEDAAGTDYHVDFVNTITFSHDIVGKLGGYVEFFSSVSTEAGSDWVGSVDLGLTYALTDDIQLDAGVNYGVTRSAPDVNPFLGVSWRF